MSESFLQPDAVPAVAKPDVAKPAVKDPNEVLEILSKRVDDSQAFIKEQAKIMELQAQKLEEYKNLEQRLKELSPAPVQTDGEKDTTPSINPEELLTKAGELFEQRLKQREEDKAKELNFSQVTSELTKRYGDRVDEVVKEIAAENDMTFQEALALAKNKPKIFMNLFPRGEAAPVRSTTPSVNTAGFNRQTQQAALPALDPMSIKSLMNYAQALEANLKRG